MTKVFEDEFMEWQIDMLEIANDYVEGRAEKIYIYGSIENGAYFFNLFFEMKNKILFMHQVNTVVGENESLIDVSPEEQEIVLRTGVEDLLKIAEVCQKYQKPVPTQFKLFYDMTKEKLDTKYQYDLQYSNTEDLYTDDIFMSWYEEVKNAVENPQEFGF